MNLYRLSFTEALRNLRQNTFLNIMVILVLTVSISIFISSIEIVSAIDSDSLTYKNPKQLKYIHLKNQSKETIIFDSKEQHISSNIIKQFIRAFDNPMLGYSTVSSLKISPQNNYKNFTHRVDLVSHDFFKILGVSPFKGTLPEYSKNEIAISFEYWVQTFKQKEVINNAITVNNKKYIISAILPKDFRTPNSYKLDTISQQKSNLWIPYANEREMFTNESISTALLFIRTTINISSLNQQTSVVYNKIKDMDKYARVFSIESGYLADLIYGEDANNSIKLLFFSTFLLIISLISVFILLSTNTTKSVQQIAMKRMLGANSMTSGMTKNLEYLVLIIQIFILTIPCVLYFKQWLSQLDFLDSLTDHSISLPMKLLTLMVSLAFLYGIFIITPMMKLRKTNLVNAIKGNFNSNRMFQFWGHHILLFIQAIVAVLLFYISYTLILDTYKNYRNLNRLNLNNKLSIQVETENKSNLEIYQKTIELKQQLKRLNGVEDVVISTASPLNLVGTLMSLSDNYHDPNAVQSLGGNSFKILNPEAKKSAFKVSIIHVEKNFFEIFDIRFLGGKSFSDNDNEVILINEQLKNIFSDYPEKPEIGIYIPANPVSENWKSGIVLGGIIDNISVFENNIISSFLKSYNLAFKVFNFNTAEHIKFTKLSFILLVNNINSIDKTQLKSLVAKYPDYFAFKNIHNLKVQANSIIAKSSTKTISALFLSLISLLLILFGSVGLVNSICTKMFKEIGIRLTVGAKDSDIIKIIFSKILTPSLLGIFVSLCAIFLFNLTLDLQDFHTLIYFIPITILLIVIISIATLIPLRKLVQGSVSEFINDVN